MFRPSVARVTAVLALGIAAAGLVLVSPAAAADLGNTYLSKTSVEIGEEVTIGGGGCFDPAQAPSDPVSVEVRGPWFVGMTWAYGGQWSTVLPGAPGGGTFTITARCLPAAGALSYSAVTITVLGPPAPPKPPQWREPGGGGPPGQPGPPVAAPAPPVGQRTTPGTPPRGPAPTPAATTTPAGTTPAATTTAPAASSPPSPVAPTPAPGCTDCDRLTGDEPVRAGVTLALSYSGFQPGEQVTLVMRSTPVELGTFPADGAGVVTAEVTLPASAEAGSHTLTFSGPLTGDHVVRFRVAAVEEQAREPVAPASEGAALTLPVLGGAVVLLLVGAGVLLYRRRAARPAGPQGADAPGQPTETPIAEPIA